MNSWLSLFIPIEKVIFSEGKKKTWGGNELIKSRKIRSIVLYHETSCGIMALNLVYENYHERVHSINVSHDRKSNDRKSTLKWVRSFLLNVSVVFEHKKDYVK